MSGLKQTIIKQTELHHIGHQCSAVPVSQTVWSTIKRLRIQGKQSTSRGFRGGSRNNSGQKPGQNKSYQFPAIYLCNPRSLNHKMGEFRSVVLANKYDLAVITESWFKPDRPTEYFDIDGYTLFSRPRADRIGGGIALYAKQDIRVNLLDINIPDNLEILWFQIRPSSLPRSVSSIIVCTLYFPDKSQEQLMLNHIQDSLDSLRAKYPDAGICIMGDMNKLDVSSLCKNNKLIQVVDKPTRGNNILDKIITSFSNFYSTPIIGSPIGLSDHSTVIWLPNHYKPSVSNKSITRIVRPMKDSGIRQFGSWIVSHDWDEISQAKTAIDKTN